MTERGIENMGFRKYKRQIAKARLKTLGAGNVNRKLKRRKDGLPLWRVMTEGKSGREAEAVQIGTATAPKAKKTRRKVEKVSA